MSSTTTTGFRRISAVLAAAALLLTLLPSGGALADDEEKVCPEGGDWSVHLSASNQINYRYIPPPGQAVAEYCVKAGSVQQGNGPEETQLSTAAFYVDLSHSSGKQISHFSVVLVPYTPSLDLESGQDLDGFGADDPAYGTWEQQIDWALGKSASVSSLSGKPGDSWQVTWTIEATKTDSGPSGYQVWGDIEVTNGTSIGLTFSAATFLNDDTETAGTVTCPTYDLESGQSTVCEYVAYPESGSATTNTAVVTVTATDPPGFHTWFEPARDTDTIDWDEHAPEIDDSVTLTDSDLGIEEEISASATRTPSQTISCPEGDSTFSVTNIASLTGEFTTETAEATVAVTCTTPPPDPEYLTGGRTIGFWGNNNGAAAIAALGDPCSAVGVTPLTNKKGVTETCAQAVARILAEATSKGDALKMFTAQRLATRLNVLAHAAEVDGFGVEGFGSAKVMNGEGCQTIASLVAVDGKAGDKAWNGHYATLFDMINNSSNKPESVELCEADD